MDSILISIPENADSIKLPDPELLLYWRNAENRVLWLDTAVDDSWLHYMRQILEWNRQDMGKEPKDRVPIKLCIYSYGGDLDVNNAFIDVIRKSKTPIWGINMGQANSAGCFIYLACHRRLAMPNSTFLIHQGSGDNFSGTFQQMVAYMEEYQRKITNLVDYLMETTKIPEDVLLENITSEWFLSADEALSYGVCDEIVDDIDEIL